MKLFLRIKETKEQVEVVSQSEQMKIRCAYTNDGSGDYLILAELQSPTLSTAQFKYLFENLCNENVSLTEECTSSEQFCTEDGLRGKYETIVMTQKLPLQSERTVVSTTYNFFDYDGKKGTHVSIQSSRGNEKFMNKESLGERLVDGYRVIVNIPINGYFVEPLLPDGRGVKVFYANRAQSNGIPYYLYKKFGASKLASGLKRILDHVGTLPNSN